MLFSPQKKKIIFSLSFILIILVVFLILNSALKKENIYTPSMKENNIIYIQNFDALSLKSDKKIYLYEIIGDKKIHVINIWASWCVPCLKENKHLMKLSKLEDIKMIGINYKDNKKNAINFLKENGDPFFLNLKDTSGLLSIKLGAYGVPETIIVDSKKKVLKKYIGPIDNNNIEEILQFLND